jgi:endothelin-converting enzyme/putative endopeptidase
MLAGLMFSPFFNDKLPMLLTMAPYGMVIGHEITHGFDNNGRLFDGVGAYRNWWTPTAEQQFMARAQCLIDQYDGFNIEGAQVNGSQTLGENIADLGGVGNAYRGMMSGNYTPNIMPPYTNEQVFFMTIAMSWCEVALPQVYAYQVENDPHSPAPFRIRGPFSNFPGFAQAFSCASTSVYGRSLTAAKCELW